MSTVLALRGLAKSYVDRAGARIDALRGVDLEVREREFVVVLGATGAGKTTLLRLIAGLEAPDAGAIEIGGRDAAALAPAERDIAYVFQNFSLYPSMSVRENLAFPLRAPARRMGAQRGEHAANAPSATQAAHSTNDASHAAPPSARADAAYIAERVAWAARLLRIEALLDRPARRLSGGEMQRVAIGRAIVREPRLFLMDEPLSNLDAKLREELRIELASLARTLGIPVLWVTHDHAEALSMADRVAVLGDGRILQTGTPRDVYRRPCSPRVGRLVGFPPLNVVAVHARESWWTSGGGARFACCASNVADGSRAELGVRPEDLELESLELARSEREPSERASAAAANVRGFHSNELRSDAASAGTTSADATRSSPTSSDTARAGTASGGIARVLDVEELGPVQLVVLDWCGVELRALVPLEHVVASGASVRVRVRPERAIVWPP